MPVGQTDLAYRLLRLSELDPVFRNGWLRAADRAKHLAAEGERLRVALEAIPDAE